MRVLVGAQSNALITLRRISNTGPGPYTVVLPCRIPLPALPECRDRPSAILSHHWLCRVAPWQVFLRDWPFHRVRRDLVRRAHRWCRTVFPGPCLPKFSFVQNAGHASRRKSARESLHCERDPGRQTIVFWVAEWAELAAERERLRS